MSPRRFSALTIEHVLLAILDQKPMHGYELYQELCALPGISKVWNIKQALLYAILEKLERRGYLSSQVVQGETSLPRKDFTLTLQGKSSLENWLKTPVRRARDLRQEFLAKLIICRRYGNAEALELIHAQKQACQAWEKELEANIPPFDQEHLDEWLVYSFRINRVKAVLDWLDTLESDFNRLQRD